MPKGEHHPEAVARDLAAVLERQVEGEVRFDPGTRALYATDLSIYRQVPVGVVIPQGIDDVIETVAACRERDVPILGRGCGTSLAGQCCNAAVVLDFSRHINQIQEIDRDGKQARVEPGVICDQLRNAAETHHLTFAPDPATHEYCTLGGMIGNDSCGVHSVMGGRTVDNIEELEILTYDGLRMRVGRTSEAELERIIRQGGRRGEIYAGLKRLRDRYAGEIRRRYPRIPRRVSGYNLDELLPENEFNVARALVGSESTCVLVLNATTRLMHSPPHRALVVIGYPDIFTAGDEVAGIRACGPIGLEAVQAHVIENMRRKGHPPAGAALLPRGDTWLLAEFGGETEREASDQARASMETIRRHGTGALEMKLLTDPHEQQQIWHIRESGVGASRVPGVEDAWPSWEDAAVAPEVLGRYLRDFYRLLHKYQYAWTIYGHFGDGCVHSRITFGLKTAEGVRKFRDFMEEAADLVVAYGGSLSGEHGDGQAKGELLPKMFGPDLMQAFREFKSIWDPHWRMNPGKKIDAYPLDQNLRLGPEYRTKPVLTHFQFPDDHGSFANATERCFGVGKCRRLEGGTMCPSFMATRQEMHSTRGRAHLLFEMLRGDAIKDGWRDEKVKEALDLCLACKGCKGDCPVQVDMATYKAEFFSHYYEGRARPAYAYALGWIDRWAALASHAPWLANLLTRTPGAADALKALVGLTPHRELPDFAGQSFRQWFQQRETGRWGDRAGTSTSFPPSPRPVLLWTDTFTNYFQPWIARAAVEVLEDAGCRVEIPEQTLCCGRPLYDFGMLDRAELLLKQILESLRPAITAGVPVIGLEPSCLAVFRDELTNLFPNDEDAQRLKQQSFLLSEFLVRQEYRPPRLQRRALVHGHCQQKAVMGMDAESELLAAMGLEFELLDAGCCGMAGSFGYEKQKYDLSMQIGERVLLPAVRAADRDTLIIANGFSCREQIAQSTDRRALHLAEVLQMALQGRRGYRPAPEPRRDAERPIGTMVAVGATALVLAGGAFFLGKKWWDRE